MRMARCADGVSTPAFISKDKKESPTRAFVIFVISRGRGGILNTGGGRVTGVAGRTTLNSFLLETGDGLTE